MNKSKKTEVMGDVFIIPNAVEKLKNFCEPEWIAEKCERMFGVKANMEDEMIQIWIVSKGKVDWKPFGGFQKELGIEGFKGFGKSKEERLLGYLPEYVPKKIFEGKKEGDAIMLTCPEYGVKIILTCNQLSYRYSRFGRFEKVFEMV